jgi:hypothetical protein
MHRIALRKKAVRRPRIAGSSSEEDETDLMHDRRSKPVVVPLFAVVAALVCSVTELPEQEEENR